MKHIIFIACLFAFNEIFSQNVVDIDKSSGPLERREFLSTGGFPLSTTKYVKVTSGSPYFSESWLKGAIETKDSVQYGNLRLRLDLIDNSVIYLNPQNQEMVCVAPLNNVSLRDSVTGKIHLFTSASSIQGAPAGKAWYEVLTSGKAILYKQYSKNIGETKAYGSSVTEQSIRTSEKYFIGINGVFTQVKSQSDITEVIAENSKGGPVVGSEKGKGKKESDLIAVVEKYNSQN